MSFYREASFPPGTKVGFYKRSEWPQPIQQEPEGPPPVPPLEVVEADTEGDVTFLQEPTWDYFYWLAAEVEGVWEYIGVSPPPFQPWTPRELRDILGTHEALTKAHGVDSTKVLQKPESPATFTQTYSTPTHVHAKAALATNLPTNLNILTTLLGTLVTEVNTSNARTNQIAEALNELKQLVNALIDDSQRDGFSK